MFWALDLQDKLKKIVQGVTEQPKNLVALSSVEQNLPVPPLVPINSGVKLSFIDDQTISVLTNDSVNADNQKDIKARVSKGIAFL